VGDREPPGPYLGIWQHLSHPHPVLLLAQQPSALPNGTCASRAFVAPFLPHTNSILTMDAAGGVGSENKCPSLIMRGVSHWLRYMHAQLLPPGAVELEVRAWACACALPNTSERRQSQPPDKPSSCMSSCCMSLNQPPAAASAPPLHAMPPMPPALQGLEEGSQAPLPPRPFSWLGRRLRQHGAAALHSPSRRSLRALRRLRQRQQAALAAWQRRLQRQLVPAEPGAQAGPTDPAGPTYPAAAGQATDPAAAGLVTATAAGEGAPSAAGNGDRGGGGAAGTAGAAPRGVAAAGPSWLAGGVEGGQGQAQGEGGGRAQLLPSFQHRRLVWLSRDHYERANDARLSLWQRQRRVSVRVWAGLEGRRGRGRGRCGQGAGARGWVGACGRGRGG
jgi:hypothetical protein